MWDNPDNDFQYDLNPYDSFMRKHLEHYGYYTGRNQGFKQNFTSFAEWEKTYGYANLSSSNCSSDSDTDSDDRKHDNKLQEELLRTTQLVYSYQDGRGMVPKLREPRNLYALAKELGPQQAARWPSEIQVQDEKIRHIRYIPPEPEYFYRQTGAERTPMVRGEENGGTLVYLYQPRPSFFVRSRVGGCRSGPSQCAVPLSDPDDKTLIFESRFESGNLAKVVKTGEYDYELWLRYDLYTNKHTQWYYFRVANTKSNVKYRFTIVNFIKSDSLYNYGMKPLMYSDKNAKEKKIGWIRAGSDIKYYRNNVKYETSKGEKAFYSLTWTAEMPHSNDTVYFAHCFPYTYTDLQDYLLDLSNDPVKSKICKQRVLCRTLAGNLVYVLTITSPSQNPEDIKHKKAVVITSRVHPGECNASWMMKGFLDYLTGNSADAKLLRDTFIFKIVPMLNPDGVIVGNYRCSLSGRDLNRNYKTVLKESYPSVWHTKNMIRKLLQEREIIVYCDLHGHSRKQNVFIYGCENRHNPEKRLRERVFPVMLNKNAPDKFKFESCKFKVQKSKEGTGRIVMWNMGIMNSYTMEATFCGSTIGKKKGIHFTLEDFEAMGYHFCDTLLDYCDPDNTKCTNVLLELEERMKREIMAKLVRQGISDRSPDDITLSDDDYSSLESSDGGSDSSVSDGPPVHLQFAPSRPVKKKKKLKTKKERDRVRSSKDDTKKPSPGDRPSSDHVCDKKSMSGHQTAHARQDKGLTVKSNTVGNINQSAQPIKYTSAQKRPKSHEERPSTTMSVNGHDKTDDKNSGRNDYLEALTNAYLRNGLIVGEAGHKPSRPKRTAAPHFRYSGTTKGTSSPFSLDGLCPHHEQTFAAQYMAQQLQNLQCGAPKELPMIQNKRDVDMLRTGVRGRHTAVKPFSQKGPDEIISKLLSMSTVVGNTFVKVWKEHVQRSKLPGGPKSNIDDLVRSQIQHQASISPINRGQPMQRHILEVSAAQQRQQEMLQQKHGDRSGNAIKQHPNPFDERVASHAITLVDANTKSGRPRATVPSATFVNYETYHNTIKTPSSDTPVVEMAKPEELVATETQSAEAESLDTPPAEQDEDPKEKKHKAKHKEKEKGGRKSRMDVNHAPQANFFLGKKPKSVSPQGGSKAAQLARGSRIYRELSCVLYRDTWTPRQKSEEETRRGMRESDEDHGPNTEGPDYVVDPHMRKGPRVRSAKATEEVDSAVESIKELRQSLASNAMQQTLSPTTGRYIKRLMKETDHDIEELTNEIKNDIEIEKKLAMERSSTVPATSKPQNASPPETVLLRENATLGADLAPKRDLYRPPAEGPKWVKDLSVPVEQKNKNQSRQVPKNQVATESKGTHPISDRTYDRTQKWTKDPTLMITGEGDNTNANYSNNSGTLTQPHKRLPDTSLEAGNNKSESNGQHNSVTLSITQPTPPMMTTQILSNRLPDKFSNIREVSPRVSENGTFHGQGNYGKGKREMRVGSATSSGSREEKSRYPNADKYFELTKRAKSAKTSRQVVGKTLVQPFTITETVPTKIQLMISQGHQEEKCFGGQFLPLSRTIRAPFYRNSSKRKQ